MNWNDWINVITIWFAASIVFQFVKIFVSDWRENESKSQNKARMKTEVADNTYTEWLRKQTEEERKEAYETGLSNAIREWETVREEGKTYIRRKSVTSFEYCRYCGSRNINDFTCNQCGAPVK